MMTATAAHPQPFQSCAPHGKKRPADNSLENEQRLSKRFDLLNLVDSNGTRLYIPVPGSSDSISSSTTTPIPSMKPVPLPASPSTTTTTTAKPTSPTKPLLPQNQSTPASASLVSTTAAATTSTTPTPPTPSAAADTSMEIEDTPHRIYISDLSAELASIPSSSSSSTNPIFIPDIEKHLSKIPDHILRSNSTGTNGGELRNLTPTKDNQLIVYGVPGSLTVPEEQDRVRKAIVEARRRIREGMAAPVDEPEETSSAVRSMGVGFNQVPDTDPDPDAMDLD